MSGKKRGRGGQQQATINGVLQGGRYWKTPLGARIHKCGRHQDVNRDTAKWRNDIQDLLRAEGGEVLVKHIMLERKAPKEMRITRLSKCQAAYISACSAQDDAAPNLEELARAAPKDDDRDHSRKLTQLHMAIQQANASVESTRQSRPKGARPHAENADERDEYDESQEVYQTTWATVRKVQKAAAQALSDFFDSQESSEQHSTAIVLAEPQAVDDELFQLVKDVAQSQITAGERTPFGKKDYEFEAWASPLTQQGLFMRREVICKDILLGTTLDHVNISLQSMQQDSTSFDMLQHVITTHKPLEQEDLSAICARFTIGQIGEDHDDKIGLQVDRKGQSESYESFIARINE